MTFFGIANAYAMRSVLSMTIMLMAGNIHKNELNADSCPRPINTHNSTNTVSCFYLSLFSCFTIVFNAKLKTDQKLRNNNTYN